MANWIEHIFFKNNLFLSVFEERKAQNHNFYFIFIDTKC